MSALEKESLIESSSVNDKLVSAKDLRIALFEFADKHKLGELNFKLNCIFWSLAAIIGLIGTSHWFIMDKLMDIAGK
jgi:hypothetical protein